MELDKEKWNKAQVEEANFHSGEYQTGYDAYADCYRQYFEYLKIQNDLHGKSILEIGSAMFPALIYCKNYKPSYIIEPLKNEHLLRAIDGKPITLISAPAEEVEFPETDEVWMLNLLTHVIDPAIIISKAKKSCKIIRFFEPVNQGKDVCHLHDFTLEDFKSYFGEGVNYYPDHKGKVKNFHEHEGAYGVYYKRF